ncbi:MAG: cyclic nucleotide-binding domain-containing protein, partial [Magnetococcales bacterium]|nr:cyclic nucleotide-binding domain-containing protein [Magnetococcales bacterium]
NPKAGLVAVVPNIIPIFVLFGVMGAFGIPLDTSTVMVAAISLGICVDDTLHFMVRYHQNIREHQDAQMALHATVWEESVPIVATSVALSLGFAALAFSNFPPVVHFGLLSTLVILMALFSTFIISPLMLQSVSLVSLWDVLGLHLKERVQKQCVIFYDLTPWQMKKLIVSSEVREFDPGEWVVKQGDEGDEMFVILEGVVEVWITRNDGSKQSLVTLGPGEIFGEMALVSQGKRVAHVTVTGSETAHLLVLNWDKIRGISKVFPRISSKLFLNLSTILSVRLAKHTSYSTPFMDQDSGAFSKDFLEAFFTLEMERSRRKGVPSSLIAFHLQGMSDFIADQGQVRCNEALASFVSDVRENVRLVDLIARWSEDRFLVLLPQTDQESLEVVLRRMHAYFESHTSMDLTLLRHELTSDTVATPEALDAFVDTLKPQEKEA